MQSARFPSLEGLDLDGTIESLVLVFSKDPDLFFTLATERIDRSAAHPIPELSALAHQVRDIVSRGYEISVTTTEAELRGAGQIIRFKRDSAEKVKSFLATVNGIARGTVSGRDDRGRTASEAEVNFVLGDRSTWSADELMLQERMAEVPSVLRISDEERAAIQDGTPAYCVYALSKSATRVVQAPSAVFRGLRHEGQLIDGIAYCGNPKRVRTALSDFPRT